MTIEVHPLEPFLPVNAKMLFLGSFPPPKARWSMEFFYPNWINDFWRIQGLIHFGDKGFFEADGEKRFDKERIMEFCKDKGIALFDTARKVRRLKDNADDNFLEIVEGTDVFELMEQMPECKTIVTTGGKASEELQTYFESHGLKVKIPKVGEWVVINDTLRYDDDTLRYDDDTLRYDDDTLRYDDNTLRYDDNTLCYDDDNKNGNKLPIRWWRMPSSSRAYPMKLEKKAEYYRRLFE